MAEGIDKLLDRLPAAEGDLRRRLTGGGLVLISLAAVFLQRAEIMDIAGLKPADLIRSPTLLIVFLLAVYAVGHVTDMIAETFVLRVGSNIVWGYSSPFNFDKSEKPWLFWPLVRPIVAPLGIYLGVFSGFVG